MILYSRGKGHQYDLPAEKEDPMCTVPSRQETVFARWHATDEQLKQLLFNEFRKKYRGCYSREELLDFLEKTLCSTCPPGQLHEAQDCSDGGNYRQEHLRDGTYKQKFS